MTFSATDPVPLTVIIPTKNEETNLSGCLASVQWASEVFVVDSQSTDRTCEIAETLGARVVQFRYEGGWPKKRQWALETLPFRNAWTLLLDADERVTDELRVEIEEIVSNSKSRDGYWIPLKLVFLGKLLRHGGSSFKKLVLFRTGCGRFEKRIENQDRSMGDMEVHEHVIVNGSVGICRSALLHHNTNSLFRYIEKHNWYSNWEAELYYRKYAGLPTDTDVLTGNMWKTQAQRRRFARRFLFRLPGFSLLVFLYRYVLLLGFLDGKPGFIYCCMQAIQYFNVKAKIYEKRQVLARLYTEGT